MRGSTEPSDKANGESLPHRILAYRGYANNREAHVMGRVTLVREARHRWPFNLRQALLSVASGLLTPGVAGVAVEIELGGAAARVATDRDGQFSAVLAPPQPLSRDRLWHTAEYRAEGAPAAQGQVFVPPDCARRVVISDIDDTVVLTGVANKLKMLWRLFVQGARSREAFPGVATLYRGLHDGGSGAEQNPMLYVSRGPWSIYEVLDEFFRMHDIPVGPILSLREWGVSLRHPIPHRGEGHKKQLLDRMLGLYSDLPFILIGDSGQHDPEIYAQAVREHPGRVEAVYIRNVSRGAGRKSAIRALAEEVHRNRSTLLLAADSLAMARHAARHGLVPPAVVQEVAEQCRQEENAAVRPETTARVEEAESKIDRKEPPNVEVR